MNPSRFRWTKGLYGIVFTLLLTHPAFAEVDFMDLKGSREFLGLKPECRYLSPEIALGLVRQGKLNQDYIYGDKDEKHSTNELVRKAFNSVSDNAAFFQVSPVGSGMAKFLSPSLLGRLIGLLSEAKSGGLTEKNLASLIKGDPEFVQSVKNAKIKETEEKLHLELFKKSLKQLEDELQSRKDKGDKGSLTSGSSCVPEAKEAYQDVVRDVAYPLSSLGVERPENAIELEKVAEAKEKIKKQNVEISKWRFENKSLNQFVKQLIASFESEFREPSETPRHTTEQLLLSIAWLNGQSKEDLLAIYKKLPSRCFEMEAHDRVFSTEPSHTEARNAWLKDKHQPEDYGKLVKVMEDFKTPKERAEYLRSHPEELAFLSHGRSFLEPATLPVLGFKQVSFILPESKAEVSMPDCMESAILNNLLNGLAGGPGNIFQVAELEKKLKKLGYQMHPDLKKFLAKYPDPSRVNEMDAHKEWAKLVSGLPGVKYNPIHPTYEIKPTVSNALKVYEYLLFYPAGKKSPFSELKTRTDKLNEISKLLSRENRKITWKLKETAGQEGKGKESIETRDTPDTDLVLEFSINDYPKYEWMINSGHSQVDPKSNESGDWRKGVGPELARILRDQKTFNTPDRHSLAWLLHSELPQIFEELKTTRGNLYHHDLLRSVPMESVDGKIFAIGELIESKKIQGIEKIRAKLPDDPEAHKRYHATLADHYYPYRETKAVTGKVYTLIEDHPILGRAWKDPRGVVWGDTVPDSKTGTDLRLNFKDANQHCLELNRPLEKEGVKAALEKINENKGLNDLRSAYLRDRGGVTRGALLDKFNTLRTENPIHGCYLPLVEEYLMLGVDLGYDANKSQYVPLFLPHLYGQDLLGNNRQFWSSSDTPNHPQIAINFNGFTGGVGYFPRSNDRSVRCVCSQ